jgi:hypothetical protein
LVFCPGIGLSTGGALARSLFRKRVRDGIAIFCGLAGPELLVKASEAYVSASPPERPDERLRDLQSRSLHVPDNSQRSRRRERNDL